MPWTPKIACLSYLPILTPPDDSEGRSGDLSAALYEVTSPPKTPIRHQQPDLSCSKGYTGQLGPGFPK